VTHVYHGMVRSSELLLEVSRHEMEVERYVSYTDDSRLARIVGQTQCQEWRGVGTAVHAPSRSWKMWTIA
jgi:hypothetical protein